MNDVTNDDAIVMQKRQNKMISQQQFKQTEIGNIPKEWEVNALKDAVEINRESKDPTREFADKKFFYIDIDSIENGSGIIKAAKKIIGKEAPSRARRLIHYKDVIMSTVRPYLKAFAIVPKEYDNQICSTGFAVLTCKERVLPLYLLYTLFSKPVIEQCNKMMVGGQYPALNTSQVEKIQLPLPPLAEQKKIAEILSAVDKAIEKVDKSIEKTQRLKKGLMQELLTRGIGHKEFKDTEIGRIPEEWEVARLEELAQIKYGLGQPPEITTNGTPMIRATNVKRGRIVLEGLIRVNPDKIPVSKEPYLSEGDIIVVRSGAYTGDTALVTKEWVGCVAGYDLIVSPLKDKLSSIFLAYVLLSNRIQFYFRSQRERSAQPHLNARELGNSLIVYPPLPEQKKIAEILGAVDKRLELLREKKGRLERVKRGLMEDLLSGRRRVINLVSKEAK